MANINFVIEKKTREILSKGTRIYRIVYGGILLIIGFLMIISTDFSILSAKSVLYETMILVGIISIIYGSFGIELFKVRYRLIMDDQYIKMKKSFEQEIRIDLNSITHLKTLALGLEITYNDYIKTYDFSWLTPDEFEKFKEKISDYCLKKKIEIE